MSEALTVLPKIIGILSAVSGAVGTGLLYKGSFAYEQLMPYSNAEMVAEMTKRNKSRNRFQRAGLALIMVSFVLAGVSVLLG